MKTKNYEVGLDDGLRKETRIQRNYEKGTIYRRIAPLILEISYGRILQKLKIRACRIVCWRHNDIT